MNGSGECRRIVFHGRSEVSPMLNWIAQLGELSAIVKLQTAAFAAEIAARREPSPSSALVVTRNVR